MAKEVIKRGGKHEAFKPEKLKQSIRKACKDARIPAPKVKRIVSKVAAPVLRFARKRKAVKVAVLRTKVLAGLRKAEPKTAKAWLHYEKRRRARRAPKRKKARRTSRRRRR
jgi:transcriptional regulator NrdR family protein